MNNFKEWFNRRTKATLWGLFLVTAVSWAAADLLSQNHLAVAVLFALFPIIPWVLSPEKSPDS